MAIPPSPLSGLKTAWFGPDGREVDATPTVIGPRGPQGVQGIQGETGETGATAYELAVANGFEGTEAEWLASLAAESAAAEQAAQAAQLAAQAAQDSAQAAEGAAGTAATDAAALAAVAAAADVVDELAVQIAQSEAARDLALNAAAATKAMPGIYYLRSESIEPGLRHADVAMLYELPATRLVARVLQGGGQCDLSVWVNGERLAGPFTVGPDLLEQPISITIPARADVLIGVDSVVGSVTGLFARIEGYPEGLSPWPGDPVELPDISEFGAALIAAEDAEQARALLEIGSGGGSSLVAWGWQPVDFALANSGAMQRLFDCSASGAVTLDPGHYHFDCFLQIEDMSTTNGNARFSILGAGSAVVFGDLWQTIGIDSATPASGGAHSGNMTRDAVQNSGTSMVTSNAATNLAARMSGRIRVTGAGTLIPSIQLATAAAATVKAGSHINIWHLPGAVADTTFGVWS